MTANALIKEINKLPLTEKLRLVEKTLKSIRQEKEHGIEHAVSLLYDDYKSDKELTIFTKLDAQSFYEPR